MLCRECAQERRLRYYAPGGGCEARYGFGAYTVGDTCAATQFPEYRGGEPRCTRPECGSDKLIMLYADDEDEFIVCTAPSCRKWRQELRQWSKGTDQMVEAGPNDYEVFDVDPGQGDASLVSGRWRTVKAMPQAVPQTGHSAATGVGIGSANASGTH